MTGKLPFGQTNLTNEPPGFTGTMTDELLFGQMNPLTNEPLDSLVLIRIGKLLFGQMNPLTIEPPGSLVLGPVNFPLYR